MNPLFSPRLLIGWTAAAVVIFAISLYLMGGGEIGSPEGVGPSTFSRSAIGHAGLAEVLQRLGIPVVKSRYDSLEKLARGSLLVIAEPLPSRQAEETVRTLLKADTILLVLPKWAGVASDQSPGWLREASERLTVDAQWALRLVAPRADVVREIAEPSWRTNALGLTPSLASPAQLVRGPGLLPLIAGERGVLLAEISERNHRIWVLSDPDVIANHGLARPGNAALAVAIINRLRELASARAASRAGSAAGPGKVVFEETIHGYVAKPLSPFFLLFSFPFVVATGQALIAVALLLWATMARFGAPQPAPATLSAGRSGLLQNIAKLIEFTGHQPVIVARYVRETVREVARALHAPRGLGGAALVAWLQRVGGSRGTDVDCSALVAEADRLAPAAGSAGGVTTTSRRDAAALVRLARDAHRWKGEILDGRAGNSRRR